MDSLPLRTGFTLERSSPFAYRCGACSRCCRDKAIPLNPYEIARLAEHLGLTTTGVITRYTDLGGGILKTGEDGAACLFLGPRGCEVHVARPLACRLYPLGRHLAPGQHERFAEVVPHPQCQGDWSGPGTVDDYLQSQDAERYVEASDLYFALLGRMMAVLSKQQAAGRLAADSDVAPVDPDNWLDIDAVVGRWCAERQREAPGSVEDRARLHVEAVDAMLRQLESE